MAKMEGRKGKKTTRNNTQREEGFKDRDVAEDTRLLIAYQDRVN